MMDSSCRALISWPGLDDQEALGVPLAVEAVLDQFQAAANLLEFPLLLRADRADLFLEPEMPRERVLDQRAVRVVRLPGGHRVEEILRVLLAVLLDELLVRHVFGEAGLLVERRVLAAALVDVHPACGVIIGAGPPREDPRVALLAAEEERDAVVRARDDHPHAAGAEADGGVVAQPVPEEKRGVFLRVHRVNQRLQFLAAGVGAVVQALRLERDVHRVDRPRRAVEELPRRDFAGDDFQVDAVSRTREGLH